MSAEHIEGDTLLRRVDGLWFEPHGSRCRVRAPGGEAVSVSRLAALTLLFLDGETPAEHVESFVSDALDEPETLGLGLIFSRLHEDGLVERVAPESLPLMALPGTEHLCEGCGRSCEGHFVGPLTGRDVERIRAHEDTLRAADPTLPERLFLERCDGAEVYLNLRRGACVFLGADRRCLVHAHVGGAMKPAICRSFPVVRVRTERGLRLGVSNACMRHHRHVTRSIGPPESISPLRAVLEDVAIDARFVEPEPLSPLRPEPDAVSRIAQETSLVSLLGERGASLDALLARLDPGAPAAEPAGRVLRAGWLRGCARFASAVLGEDIGEGEARTGFGRDLLALERALRPSLRAPLMMSSRRFDADAERALLDELRRLLWLREYVDFDTPRRAIYSLLAGWSLLVDADIEAGLGFAVWCRVLKAGAKQRWEGQVAALRSVRR